MVAITTPPAVARPRRTGPTPLRVVPGRPAAAGRRRGRVAVAAAMLAVVVAAALYLVQAEPVPAPGTVPVAEATHTVGEGETMWSIATDVAPAGEAATYVERLVDVNGTARVVPGQVLALPVP